MRLRFVGEDGSMGLRAGGVYEVKFKPRNAPFNKPFTAIFLGNVECPYDSDVAFWKNWMPPTMADEGDFACAYSKRHAPHLWATLEDEFHCPGRTKDG